MKEFTILGVSASRKWVATGEWVAAYAATWAPPPDLRSSNAGRAGMCGLGGIGQCTAAPAFSGPSGVCGRAERAIDGAREEGQPYVGPAPALRMVQVIRKAKKKSNLSSSRDRSRPVSCSMRPTR